MSTYTDAFVLPLPTAKIDAYQKAATLAGAVWREYGALSYRECVLNDPDAKDMVSFPKLAGAQEGETVVVAFITYESREHRDAVNAKVMADPRIQEICGGPDGPVFDYTRMAYGGFETIVEA